MQALQNRLRDPPTALEKGILFETWMVRELIRIRDYTEKGHELTLWRHGRHEIDIVISGSRGPLLAIECKTGQTDISSATTEQFRRQFPRVPLYVASLTDTHPRRLASGITIHPWRNLLEMYRQL